MYPKRNNELNLHGGFLVLSLLDLGDLGGRLASHAATAPVLSDLIEPVIVVGLDSFHELGQGATVARLNLEKGVKSRKIKHFAETLKLIYNSGNRLLIKRVMGLALIYSIITFAPEGPEDNHYLSDGETGGGLPPADSAKARLILDDAVGDSHLPAESREEHHQLQQTSIISCTRTKSIGRIKIRFRQICHPTYQVKRFKTSFEKSTSFSSPQLGPHR